MQFQLDDICKENTDADIRRALRSLPRDLNETYDRILARILKYRNADNALRLIQLVTVARESLSLGQLRELMALRPGDYCWADAHPRLPTSSVKMLQDCETLLTVIETDSESYVQFTHYTALEYIRAASSKPDKFFFSFAETEQHLGRLCLTYLNLSDFETQIAFFKPPVLFTPVSVIHSIVRPSFRLARYWNIVSPGSWKTSQNSYNLNNLIDSKHSKLSGDGHVHTSNFLFLGYALAHWLVHCSEIPAGQSDTLNIFRRLALDEVSPVGFSATLPWRASTDYDDICNDLPFADQFKWSILNNHLTLLQCVIGHQSFTANTLGSYLRQRVPEDCTLLEFVCTKVSLKIFRVLLGIEGFIENQQMNVLRTLIRMENQELTNEALKKIRPTPEDPWPSWISESFRASCVELAVQNNQVRALQYLTEIGFFQAQKHEDFDRAMFVAIENVAFESFRWLQHIDPDTFHRRQAERVCEAITKPATNPSLLQVLTGSIPGFKGTVEDAAILDPSSALGFLLIRALEWTTEESVKQRRPRPDGVFRIACIFLASGASTTTRSYSGLTALDIICHSGDKALLHETLIAYVDPQSRLSERTVLEICWKIDYDQIDHGISDPEASMIRLKTCSGDNVIRTMLKDRRLGQILYDTDKRRLFAVILAMAIGFQGEELVLGEHGSTFLKWLCGVAWKHVGHYELDPEGRILGVQDCERPLAFPTLKRAILNMLKAIERRRSTEGDFSAKLFGDGSNIVGNVCRFLPSPCEIIQQLRRMGCEIDERDENGRTALITCCQGVHNLEDGKDGLSYNKHEVRLRMEATIISLVQAGADPTQTDIDSGLSTVMLVCRHSWFTEGAIRTLVLAGADVNYKDRNGRTALVHYCSGFQNMECSPFLPDKSIMAALIDVGANVNAIDPSFPYASSVMLCCWNYQDAVQLVAEFCSHGLDFNYRDAHGKTVLMQCCSSYKRFNLAMTLIENGAHTSATANDGTTALMMAINSWNQLLLDDYNQPVRLMPLLRLLIEKSTETASLDSIRPSDGFTALLLACNSANDLVDTEAVKEEHNPNHVVSALCAAGANPFIRDNEGRNAWDLAEENRDYSALQALSDHASEDGYSMSPRAVARALTRPG